jgi:betaine-aldehyde dehydrogenase
MVALTGSVRAGREVMAAAAPTVKRLHLELGGKAPVLVFDDCDLDLTVAGLLDLGYYNAGQSCTAATRVLAAPGVTTSWSPGWPPARPRCRSGRTATTAP